MAIPRAAFDRVLRGLGCRLPFQPGQARRTLAQAPRRRTSATVHGLATQVSGVHLLYSLPFPEHPLKRLGQRCVGGLSQKWFINHGL